LSDARNNAPNDAPKPDITLYTTAICPYCVAAKNFLKSKGQSWTEVRVDLDPAERQKMMALAKRTSVPQIFIGDTHVGGYDDMVALHRAGKLEPLLSSGRSA
jgi:glutaredoxin 3